jgi:DNA-binding helix-hairpin-helix protein with protein kinase domain
MAKKVQAMLTKGMNSKNQEGLLLFTWPEGLLKESSTGKFVGYVMPKLQNMKPLFDLKSPASRKQANVKEDPKFLVTVARNVASVVRHAHSCSLVLGDISDMNIWVDRMGRVTFIDTDSFQFFEKEQFFCRVGSPEYLAPELIGHPGQYWRNPSSDLFSLGVVIFQLLMNGYHPYMGVGPNSTSPFDPSGRIKAGLFTDASKKIGVTPPAGRPPWDNLSQDIQNLFIQCFDAGHCDPSKRPSAGDWETALQGFTPTPGPTAQSPTTPGPITIAPQPPVDVVRWFFLWAVQFFEWLKKKL